MMRKWAVAMVHVRDSNVIGIVDQKKRSASKKRLFSLARKRTFLGEERFMYREILSNQKGTEETAKYLLLSLITILLRLTDLSKEEMEEEEFELGEKIKKYIDDNFLSKLSIKSLAKRLGHKPILSDIFL